MVMIMSVEMALDARSEAAMDTQRAVHTSQLHTMPRAIA